MPISDALMIALVGMIVVIAELSLLAGIIVIMSKIVFAMTAKKAKVAAVKTVTPVVSEWTPVAAVTLPETQSAGSLDLHSVDDKTAAMLMAIVSDEAGIPLNELRFRSIKALD